MTKRLALCLIFLILPFSISFGEDGLEQRVRALEDASSARQKTVEEQGKTIEEMKKGAARTEGAATDPEGRRPSGVVGLPGVAAVSNPNISLIVNTFIYSSNIEGSGLSGRSIPGFTNTGIESGKGFNLEAAELSISAPVDPYFNLYALIPVTEDGAEVEEAYFVTTSLPEGLQAKGGKFKSGFGRINSQHPHAWDFADSPLVYRAFIGGEGLAEKGVQLTYLPRLPFYTQLGIEALQGENPVLFGPDAASGPHAYAAFVKASLDLGDYSTILFGPSAATGKTKTDSIADDTEFAGSSTLYGFELTYKWKPSRDRSFALQGEYMLREQEGDLTDTALSAVNTLKRSQDGAYLQSVYRFGRWGAGVRYDVLEIFKGEYVLAGAEEGFGRRPWRAAGEIEFNPTEFSRIRVQYNHDRSGRDGRTNNEVYLQFILGIGAHAAHPF